jgi:hypothetical protein
MVPVEYVYKHAKKGYVSIHLVEGDKDFSSKLLRNLSSALDEIRALTIAELDRTHASVRKRNIELSRIHLH